MVFVIVTHGWVLESLNKYYFKNDLAEGYKVEYCSFNLLKLSESPDAESGRYEIESLVLNEIAYEKTD